MLEIKPTTRFALEDNLILQDISELDHYYAFDTKNGDHYQLNHTAHWVLESIGNGVSFQGLLDKFTQVYDLRQEEAMNDLLEIIQTAFENHIIKEVVS
ncbi:MAG: PqqD family protein [Desulfosalsimonadaceae bacterium]